MILGLGRENDNSRDIRKKEGLENLTHTGRSVGNRDTVNTLPNELVQNGSQIGSWGK